MSNNKQLKLQTTIQFTPCEIIWAQNACINTHSHIKNKINTRTQDRVLFDE